LGGPLILGCLVNAPAAALALLALVLYVFLYTPLKRRTPGNTLIGALVGALPPLIGWVAARGTLAPGAWILAGILFLWQIPHFLALAWLYRDDYARGGFRMLPSVDPTGRLTGCAAVVYTLVLWQATVLLTLTGVTGWWYLAAAATLGGALLLAAVHLERERTSAAARRLFIASLVYLPLLLALMLLDRRVGGSCL
jgi:protoheme IX farnesyltransferase